MRKLLFTLLLVTLTASINAQSIFGEWENRDEKTNKVNSVVQVYQKDGRAFAKIVKITNPERQGAVCDKCEGDNKDKPILGMHILYGLKKKSDEWSGGKILDPQNGKEYKCYIKLVGENKLKIRGYIGFAAFGRTAYWYREKKS